jgi:hypothetical protein
VRPLCWAISAPFTAVGSELVLAGGSPCQSTTTALPLSQITCSSGEFAPETALALQTLDLSTVQPIAAPELPGPLPASALSRSAW